MEETRWPVRGSFALAGPDPRFPPGCPTLSFGGARCWSLSRAIPQGQESLMLPGSCEYTDLEKVLGWRLAFYGHANAT
jgi:hypothetical protein